MKSDKEEDVNFCNSFKSNFFTVLDDAVQGYNKIKLNLINVITKESDKTKDENTSKNEDSKDVSNVSQ